MSDRVAFAYVHSAAVSYSWHNSYSRLLRWDLAHEGRIFARGAEIAVHGGTGGLVAARNQGAREFLKAAMDWLFWIDTDMGFEPDTVDRLLEAADPVDRPVVGGLCFAQKVIDGEGGYRSVPVPTIYDWDAEESTFRVRWDYERDALLRCAGTGSACILIHRSVLERIAQAQGPVWYDLVPHPGGERIGEDLSFCLRAAALEFPVHVHSGVKTSHLKQVHLDETEYRVQRAGLEAALA